jgi:hypothetical protein
MSDSLNNIDKQAYQVSRYDLVSGYMQKWPDGEFVYHSDYQALLDEKEAAENRIAELEANNDSAHKALINARHRTVTMPTGYSIRPGHPINETERSVMIPKDGGQWLSRFDVEHALRVAGIRINRDE